MGGSITSERSGAVTVLRMEHGRANTIDLELLAAIDAALDHLRDAPGVVLTGSGSIFSAGVDLVQVAGGGTEYLDRLLPALRRTFDGLAAFPRPLVAAVNGHAIAGGCILALTADRRVMASGPGRVGVTEALVGVPFSVDALELIRLAVGDRNLGDLVLSGRTVEPPEALTLGLVDEVVAPEAALERAVEVAETMARIPSRTFELLKSSRRRPFWDALRTSAEFDARADAQWKSEPAQEAIRAYVAQLKSRKS